MEKKLEGMQYFDLAKGRRLTQQDLEDYCADMYAIFDEFPKQVADLQDILALPYDKVYAIGIGDSLYSAESVKLGFWKNSSIQLEVLESLEFNYYYLDYMPENSLVLVCSGGGQAGRTVESSFLAQKRGATVVNVTLSPQSRLTTAGKYTLCHESNKKNYIDGSRNFMALAAMVMVVGVCMGAWNGTLSAESERARYEDAKRHVKIGFETVMTHEDTLQKLMEEAKSASKFYFLGAGPSYILTEYASAKFMEQSAADGIHQELEEYGHEQYWVHNRNGHGEIIFSICPEGKSVTRCLENLSEQQFLGMNTVVVTTPEPAGRMRKIANYVIDTTAPVEETNFWLVAGPVFARLANFYTDTIGRSEKMFANNEQFAEHYTTIQFTRFCPEVAEHDIPVPDEDTIQQRGAHGLSFQKEER